MLTVVRHPPIDPAWKGRCYGQTDVALADDDVTDLVQSLARYSPTIVWHSGLIRTERVAACLAKKTGAELREDPRLRERHFGEWEGRTWDDIYAETGSAMDGMIEQPATWRPPGGETTFALRDRIVAWYNELDTSERHIAITHGGPIAAFIGTRSDLRPSAWPSLIPNYGEWCSIAE